MAIKRRAKRRVDAPRSPSHPPSQVNSLRRSYVFFVPAIVTARQRLDMVMVRSGGSRSVLSYSKQCTPSHP